MFNEKEQKAIINLFGSDLGKAVKEIIREKIIRIDTYASNPYEAAYLQGQIATLRLLLRTINKGELRNE